ncbi:right-handed parallel beta-helix repeat-containing protein [Sphingomonas sp. RS6]
MPDIIVKNQSELNAALAAATGGETIKLAAGTYQQVKLNNVKYASNVTITSLDPDNPATVQRVDLDSSSNITFRNLTLARDLAPTDADYTRLHNVNKSSNIVFDAVTISGGSGDVTQSVGWGMFVRDSSNITIMNSSVDHVALALNISNVNGLLVKDNSFHDNRRDGLNLSSITNAVIDGNFFTDMYPVNGEHPDAIQFLTRGQTTASSNIVIKNNVVMQGKGEPIQGIFLNDEEGNLPYTNVEISNNLIYVNGMYNGISVTGGKNITVESNTVVSRTDDTIPAWIRLERVDGATVRGNVGDRLVASKESTNIVETGNSWLSADSVTLRKFANINGEHSAKLSEMIVSGIGYQPPAGSAAAALVAQEQLEARKTSSAGLLLDLEFSSTGMVEKSKWNSVATATAIDATNIDGTMYHVQTGKGFSLSQSNSVQLYNLPAFTLSFDFKRQSMTSTAGQIIGVFQSWSVSLRSDGELNFTIKNDAGKTFSLVTSGAKIIDTKNHKIALTYDSKTGKAIIYVDNVVRGSTAISGSTRALESWGLYVGSPFGTAANGYVGNIEMRDSALSPAQVVALASSGSTSSALRLSMVQSVAATAVGSGTGAASTAARAEASAALVTAIPSAVTATATTASASVASRVSVANTVVPVVSAGDLSGLARRSMSVSKFSGFDIHYA